MQRQIVKIKRPPVRIDDAKDPEVWRTVGRRLLKGARLIWSPLSDCLQGYKTTRGNRTPEQARDLAQQADYFAPFFVLAGLAVETHLKARIIERRIAAGKHFPDGMAVLAEFPRKSHDLKLLAKCADVPLTAGIERLLDRLSEFVVWTGRYPIPVKAAAVLRADRTTRETDLEDIERFIASLNR